jgi:hypothetical protein
LFLFVASSIYEYIITIHLLAVYTALYLCKYSLKGNQIWLFHGYALDVKGSIEENQQKDLVGAVYVGLVGSSLKKRPLRI